MELINNRFFKLKGGLAAQEGSGTRVRYLLQVTRVLTKYSLLVDRRSSSGKKTNYVMNEQYSCCWLPSGWLKGIHSASWVFRNFTNYRSSQIFPKLFCIASLAIHLIN